MSGETLNVRGGHELHEREVVLADVFVGGEVLAEEFEFAGGDVHLCDDAAPSVGVDTGRQLHRTIHHGERDRSRKIVPRPILARLRLMLGIMVENPRQRHHPKLRTRLKRVLKVPEVRPSILIGLQNAVGVVEARAMRSPQVP